MPQGSAPPPQKYSLVGHLQEKQKEKLAKRKLRAAGVVLQQSSIRTYTVSDARPLWPVTSGCSAKVTFPTQTPHKVSLNTQY